MSTPSTKYWRPWSRPFVPTIGTAVDGYLAAIGTTWVDWEARQAPIPPPLDRRGSERLEQPQQLEPS